MSLKAKLEAIIYAAEEPVTLDQLALLLKDAVLADLRTEEAARLALNETIAVPRPADDSDELPEDTTDENRQDERSSSVATAPSALPDMAGARSEKDRKAEAKDELKSIKARLSGIIDELVSEYSAPDRGMEIRQVAGGYRMATKPEHHDVVVTFAKSLKPPVRLSLQALETLAVIAYRQPVTVPEISEIRGVDSAGVISTLLDRKLITTGGRKQVIGRPILYKTTKEFLMRFGLNDVAELPSMEEFEKLGDPQSDLFAAGESDISETVTEGASANSNTAPLSTAPTSNEYEAEPVTEAVPELASSGNSLVGESIMPADGTYATEAQPEKSPEKP